MQHSQGAKVLDDSKPLKLLGPQLPSGGASQLQQQVTQQQHQQSPEHSGCSPVQAWQQGKISLSLSGGGFLLPYHLGVYQSLAAMGIVSSATPMAGSSAGSLVVGAIKSGLSLQQQMDSLLEAAHACRQQGVTGRLRKVLKAQLNRTLPDDAAARCSDGTCWVSVTQVFPRPSNKLYGGFDSRQQLIKALLASCHLPRISDGSLFTSYKALHKRVFDGGFSNLCPVPPILPSSRPPVALSATATSNQALAAAAATGIDVQPSSSPHSSDGVTDSGLVRSNSMGVVETTAAAGSTTEEHPTAPASALILQRVDSTKGITTKLMQSKSRAKNTSTPQTQRFSRSLTAPATAQGSSSSARSPQQLKHSSTMGHGGGQPPHKGFKLHAAQSHREHQPQHQRQAHVEQLLAAACEVVGPGVYVAAEGWFAVRVCLLPARSMHELPIMFRAPAADEVAIALDMFQDWPHDLDATTNLALYPQDDDFLWDLFRRGQQDGASWAQQQGFPADVLRRIPQQADTNEALAVSRSVGGVAQQQQQQGGLGSAKQQEQEAAAVVAAAEGMHEVQGICLGVEGVHS